MKLKVIQQSVKKGACTIRCGKNGGIWFGKVVQDVLGLEAGDKVDFLQDEEHPKDFYLRKLGGSLELRKGSGATLTVAHASFVRAMCDIYNIKPPFSMLVSERPNDECVYALVMDNKK